MTQISINYARVLYELSIPKQDVDYSKELFDATEKLYESLVSPVVSFQEKAAVIDRLFPETMRSFFKVLCRNGSVPYIHEIFEAYKQYTYEQENVLDAKLFYVQMPEENQIIRLKEYLMKRFHKKGIEFEYIHAPELIAGFVIEAAGVRIDESIQGRLKRMQQKLVKR